jgi:hypothetical protein
MSDFCPFSVSDLFDVYVRSSPREESTSVPLPEPQAVVGPSGSYSLNSEQSVVFIEDPPSPVSDTAARAAAVTDGDEWAEYEREAGLSGTSVDLGPCVAKLNEALYGTSDWQTVEAALAARRPVGGVCPETWGSGGVAFRCVECAVDKNCVVCARCFFNSKKYHIENNHTIKFIRTTGGCCDCGDPGSWDSRGFCQEHRCRTEVEDGMEAFNSLKLLDPKLADRAAHIIPSTVTYLCLRGFTDRNVAVIRSLLPWLQNLAKINLGWVL